MIRDLAPQPSNPQFRFDDSAQEQIHRRLLLIGEGPAAFFRDACRLMSRPESLETTTHLVGHCLREIESAIQHVLLPFGAEESKTSAKGAAKARNHRSKVDRIIAAYCIDPNGTAARLWRRISDSTNEFALHRRAHRDALGPPRSVDEVAIRLWREMQELLDEVLDRFEAQFIEHIRVLERLAALEDPTDDELDQLRNNVPNNAICLVHFFSKARPAWLPLLRKGGYFEMPPDTEVVPDGAYVRYPPWPASQYLARIAKLDLDETCVAELGSIVASIPDTDNVAVFDDLVLASMIIPLDDAIRVAHKAIGLLGRNRGALLPERLAGLSLRLLHSGRIPEGLQILAELIRCEPADSAFGDPLPQCDQYQFDVILRDIVPVAVQVGGVPTFALLCNSLAESIRPIVLNGDVEHLSDDGCNQRSAIESHAQDRFQNYGVLSAFIDAVRNAGEALLGIDQSVLPELVEILELRPALVFRRLAMHFLRTNPRVAPHLVAKYLLNERYLNSVEVWHEQRLLERDCFCTLDAQQQSVFLERIVRGPEPEPQTDEDTKLQVVAQSLSKEDSHAERWRLHHMDLIAEDLTDNLKAYHRLLVAKYGKPSHPDFLAYIDGGDCEVQFGPLSDTEVNNYSVPELLEFLQRWSPRDDRDNRYSRGELASQLANRVSREPDVFAASAKCFIGLHSAYARALFEGWKRASSEGRVFAWDEPLNLGLWAAQAGHYGPSGAASADLLVAREWDWTRTELARLIIALLEDRPNCFNVEHGDRVLAIIALLLQFPDTADYQHDPLDQAINSFRGCSMTALIHWACWTCRSERRAGRPGNLAAMPHARDLLDAHTNPAIDSSKSTRAVLGYHLPNLVAVDVDWVEAHLAQLVPCEHDAAPLLHETWGAYLWRCRPDPGMLRILQPQFASAIALKAGQHPRNKGYVEALIRHLAPLYWSGYLKLDDGPLARFTATADVTARREFLKHIGFCIHHTEGTVETEVLDRAKAYWESRVQAMRLGETTCNELVPFGWWFASGKFDDTWALEQLEMVLATCGTIDLEHAVAERLALLAASVPVRVIQCLLVLSNNDTNRGRALLCRTGIRGAINAARTSNNSHAQNLANELVSRLIARGYTEFREFA